MCSKSYRCGWLGVGGGYEADGRYLVSMTTETINMRSGGILGSN
jgi:hypothetical protein